MHNLVKKEKNLFNQIENADKTQYSLIYLKFKVNITSAKAVNLPKTAAPHCNALHCCPWPKLNQKNLYVLNVKKDRRHLVPFSK